ncbi:NAD(P)-dependent alcohol dehydrogenase [Phycicoccus sp. BSK3Z-2]|uniref:NAD(P)-dependent alcohol dehydrogenase n=1 Tax=Phycicoccus avicenniae TaxID=2828860 RepID=A0A941D9Q1_9MICO|nr:NAD(P)-dependent alcohol dehydrogenase [Phycicoccus avicenniae]MBR7744340.1 NAD(P)-dependent alcohol dehydrogenase [Phycicoccus avicenniae]
MRAAVTTRYGGPDAVEVRDHPEPVPAPHDLVVRVHVTTVNRTDCAYRAAHPWFMRAVTGLRAPRVRVWWTEYAGVVTRVGSEVTAFAAGDVVFGYAEGRFGAHAELVAVADDSMVATVPPGVGLDAAAAATEGGHYALSFLWRSGVRPGDRVLVHGATGAIGSATVQLLLDLGADVTATAPTEGVDVVRGLGARRVVDWRRGGIGGAVGPFDAVLDAVGRSTFAQCRPLLAPGGTYVSSELGPFAQNPVLALATPLARRRRVVFPLPVEGPQVIEHLRARLAAGTFRPLLDRTYPLDDIADAYRHVETGTKVGSVLVRVRPPEEDPPLSPGSGA